MFGLEFVDAGNDLSQALLTNYNYWIVLLSYITACIGAYAGLNVVSAMRTSHSKQARLAWGATGAVALGCAIWSMHFIGMLAYSLPINMKMSAALTAASIVPAIAASGLAIYMLNSEKRSVKHIITGAVLLGAGIGIMHYTGMAAMQGAFTLRYDLGFFLLSIIVAVGLALVALLIGIGNTHSNDSSVGKMILSALAMGAAITGMHYTGMEAAYFFPNSTTYAIEAMDHTSLVAIITAITVVLSVLAVVSAIVNKMFQELYTATEKAHAAAQEKADFLARMSHEIRTPMNAVIGLTRIVLKSDLTENQKSTLNKITKASSQLLSIINGVLDYSKIDAGKMAVESIKFDLNEVLNSVHEAAQPQAAEKNLELFISKRASLPACVSGDPSKLTQVLTNLISNAIKFTDQGSVTIGAGISENIEGNMVLQFSISDTGLGMSEDQMRHLFQAFTQADSTITRKFGGTGLGLAISRELCDLMGGRIWVESKVGEGSTFHFTIRVLAIDASISNDNFRHRLNSLNVLLLDDNPADIANIMDILTQYDVSAKYVSNGYDAITLLEQAEEAGRPYDILLADWRLPGKDGIEVAMEIEQNPNIPRKPKTIIVSAYARHEMDELTDNLGLAGFLSKPVSPNLLIDAFMNCMIDGPAQAADTCIDADNEDELRFDGVHALLVEDNMFNQEIAIDALQDLGISSDLAENGLEALEKVSANSYDVILMDIQMPEMDGLTATREIRKRWPELKLPIIAMTAHALPGEKEKSIEAGMDDHMTKPFELNDLRSVLKPYVRSKKGATETSSDGKEQNQHRDSYEILVESVLTQRCNNDQARIRKTVNAFLRSYQDVNSMELMLKEQDHKAAQSLAHTLISSASYLGAESLVSRSRRIEGALKSENTADAMASAVDFDRELEALIRDAQALSDKITPAVPAVEIVNVEEALVTLVNLSGLLENDDFASEDLADKFSAHLGVAANNPVFKEFLNKVGDTDYESALEDVVNVKSALLELAQ